MQLSFFDHAMQYQGGKKSMKFLGDTKEIIPFEALVTILIEEGIYKPEVGKKGGRPQAPAKILLGALFLQSWYNLSVKEMKRERLSLILPTINKPPTLRKEDKNIMGIKCILLQILMVSSKKSKLPQLRLMTVHSLMH